MELCGSRVPLLENLGVEPMPKPKTNSIKNPQSNAIVERAHHIIGKRFDMYADVLRVGQCFKDVRWRPRVWAGLIL